MLELYHHGSSVCAAKVRLALFEKGLEWHGHYVDILAGEQFTPHFLALNPSGLVPVLVHDREVIRESTIINEYIDEAFAGPLLRPPTVTGRAMMRIWTKMVDEVLHPAVGPITFAVSHRYTILDLPEEEREAYLSSTPDPVQRDRKRLWVEKGFEAPDVRNAMHAWFRALLQMEGALQAHTWLAGDEYSLADIAFTPYIARLDTLGMWRSQKLRYPKVAEWFERVMARDSFGPALLEYLPHELRTTMLRNAQRSAEKLHAFLAAVDEF